ncbi:MAG: rhomboid family intramembrane serine protease [Verrucomicrobiota bacterium]|jgi:membrane associated rhomboid family serine protease
MELPDHTRIPTRNRRQTMDWGLVLMSQGIAATIDDGADGGGWCLWVSTADHPAAMRAIRLYLWENRHWHWRQPLPWRGFHFDWKIILWALLLIAVHVVSFASGRGVDIAGRMDSAAVRAGQWWRIFTAMLLHADVAHLASNVSLGVVLLGLVMGRYGSGTGLLAAYLAGATGNLAGLVFYPEPHFGVGASGMVMGGLGLLAVQSVTLLRHGAVGRKYVFRGLLAGLMLFVLFGLSPETDVVAHFGGFVTGLALGGVLVSLPNSWQNPQTDAAAAIVFGGLLITTGWLAFR